MTASAASLGDYRASAEDPVFRSILEMLRERTGADFKRYRTATVVRRVMNRMISVGAGTFLEYAELLRSDAAEAARLLERMTIKVSRFYRNRAAFDALRFKMIPELAAARGGKLHVWSAGCGYGEEAYTLAMLLDEAGVRGLVEATDIDPYALQTAARACYTQGAVTELPEDLGSRYLELEDGRYLVRPAVRERVRFSRHNLIAGEPCFGSDASFDILCCRNVLIYFDRELQESVLRRLRQRIRSGGVLSLGEAEWPSAAGRFALTPLDRETHLYRAVDSSWGFSQ